MGAKVSRRSDSGIKFFFDPKDGLPFNGNTAPLWGNTFQGVWYGLSLFALISSLGIIIAFVGFVTNFDSCFILMKPIFLLNGLIHIPYFLWCYKISEYPRASDTEWSRIMGTTLGMNLGLAIIALAGFLLLFLHLTGSGAFVCPGAEGLAVISHPTFLSVAIATALSMILVGATSFIVFLIFIQFYVVNSKGKYTYKITRDIFDIEE